MQLRQVEHVHPRLCGVGRRQQVRLPVQVDHAQRVHRLVEVRGGQAGGLLQLLARHLLDLALGQRRASLVLAHPGVHDHRLISGEAEVSRHAGALGDVLVLVGGLPAVEVERLTPGDRELATLLQILQLTRGVVVPARDVGCDVHLAQQLPHGLRGLGRCSLHHSLLLAEVSLDRRAHSSSSTDDLLRLDTSALRGGACSRGGVCLHAGWCDHQLGELKPADPVELWVLIDVLHREVGVQMVAKAATVRGDLPVREALVQHLEQVLTQRVARRGRLEVLREQRRHLPDLRVEGTRRTVGQAGRREDVGDPRILPQQIRQCRVQNAYLRRGRLLQLVQQILRVNTDAAHGLERVGERDIDAALLHQRVDLLYRVGAQLGGEGVQDARHVVDPAAVVEQCLGQIWSEVHAEVSEGVTEVVHTAEVVVLRLGVIRADDRFHREVVEDLRHREVPRVRCLRHRDLEAGALDHHLRTERLHRHTQRQRHPLRSGRGELHDLARVRRGVRVQLRVVDQDVGTLRIQLGPSLSRHRLVAVAVQDDLTGALVVERDDVTETDGLTVAVEAGVLQIHHAVDRLIELPRFLRASLHHAAGPLAAGIGRRINDGDLTQLLSGSRHPALHVLEFGRWHQAEARVVQRQLRRGEHLGAPVLGVEHESGVLRQTCDVRLEQRDQVVRRLLTHLNETVVGGDHVDRGLPDLCAGEHQRGSGDRLVAALSDDLTGERGQLVAPTTRGQNDVRAESHEAVQHPLKLRQCQLVLLVERVEVDDDRVLPGHPGGLRLAAMLQRGVTVDAAEAGIDVAVCRCLVAVGVYRATLGTIGPGVRLVHHHLHRQVGDCGAVGEDLHPECSHRLRSGV